MKRASFWVTNISKMNVSLTDLNLTIKSFTTVNLLDNKHYSYSVEQLIKSATEGSIFKKRDKIVIRQKAPEQKKNKVLFDRETMIPSRERSLFNIKEEYYEELDISDEEFAKENADTAEIDSQKQIISKR
jgi:hypothetical protein